MNDTSCGSGQAIGDKEVVIKHQSDNSASWFSWTRMFMVASTLMTLSLTGCTALFSPIDSIPAARVPAQFLAEPQANKVPIDASRLRQPKPEFYTLDSEDVLGIFIEGVLGNLDEAPPVQIPPLPLIQPIPVRGLTIQQAEALISRAYLDGAKPFLTKENRIIVTLFRERTHRVFVIRQDNSFAGRGGQFQGLAGRQGVTDRNDQSSRGFVLQLAAYKNDVLNALSQTGGLPGVNAKAQIRILRGDRLDIARRDAQLAEFYRSNTPEKFPYGIVPSVPDATNSITIPTRLGPGEVPSFRPEDIILRDGDIVYVDSRETDVYYTQGLLQGGEFPLPRDYDLDVLAAVSLAGTSVGAAQQTGLLGGSVSRTQPTELIILRRLPGDRQLNIRVDLNEAINDPRQRILVKAGDTLTLRFKPQEELINFATATFFTFGVNRIFR